MSDEAATPEDSDGRDPVDAATAGGPGLAEPAAGSAPVAPDSGYTTDGVPTLQGIREKIETRFGAALGATELAEETAEARTAAQQYAERQQAAADKLEQIRSAMRHDRDT